MPDNEDEDELDFEGVGEFIKYPAFQQTFSSTAVSVSDSVNFKEPK